jgi:alpha-beta hydrolase superfamily lysophospholipase
MFEFTDSLKEALEKVQPYRKQKKILKEAKKALIVFIPGWNSKLSQYKPLLEATLNQLERKNWNDWVSSWDILPFDYDNKIFSLADPKQIAENLVSTIKRYLKHLVNFEYSYQNIFLLGHSLGGLIARQAALFASEKKEEWFGKVKLVLLASANRGYATDLLPLWQIILDKLVSNVPRLIKQEFLINKAKRGSDFVNEIRLSWLRNFAEPSEGNRDKQPIAPPTIQLIGTQDILVKREDSIDIYRFKNTDEKLIEDINHSDFLENENTESLRRIVENVVTAFEQHFLTTNNASKQTFPFQINQPNPPDCLVFLIHGIRDFAGWHETLEYEIQLINPRARVVSVRYGYFTALQFLLPLQRSKNVRIFIDHYIQEISRNPNIPIHVAAHSYGTYLFGRGMKRQSGIFVNRVYFAGSVLPRNFNWNQIFPRLQALRNDCANGDWAVGVLCYYLRFLPWNWNDIGIAGTKGFSGRLPNIRSNQYLKGDHGAALQFPVTKEIADFLLSPSLNDDQWNLKTSVKNLQHTRLILHTFLFLFLFALVLGIFAAIIILCSVQWLAVIFSAAFTAFVIWLLLSV